MSIESLSAHVAEARWDEADREIRRALQSVESYRDLLKLCRLGKRLRGMRPDGALTPIRVALISDATIDQIVEPLSLMLETAGFAPTMYSSGFGAVGRELLIPDSPAAEFEPDVAVVIVTPLQVAGWPGPDEGPGQVDARVRSVSEQWLSNLETFHRQAGCDIILDTYHPLPRRPFGSYARRLPGDANRFLRSLNDHIADSIPSHVHLHDVAAVASNVGVDRWFDARHWYHSKQPISFDCIAAYTRSLAGVIAALFGRTSKCLVLDLDNTLWGGVVGDDGPAALRIGEGDAEGEAFKAFQQYLLELKDRGVLLAVCSKNEQDIAEAAIEQIPEMVLRRSDFAAFVANWDPKSRNIEDIAQRLNLGLDALVFVDDNPAEREEVRRALPTVRVLELTEDPADYPALLDRSGWLETTAFSKEDRERSRLYSDNQRREEARARTGDYDDYLRSLNQQAVIRPFEERYLDRITQLTNKTNQFNLTTQRMSRSDLEARGSSSDYLTAYVRLTDRFGDNGLVSVFVGHRRAEVLEIDLWLMSCRVFGRGVERSLLNHVVDRCRAVGVEWIRGTYIPTERNGLVKDLYARLGFSEIDPTGPDGNRWELRVGSHVPPDVPITIVDEY